VVDRNKQIANENQRLKRFLVSCMYEFGSLNVSYQSACRVQDDDTLVIEFNKNSGVYSCRLVEEENAERMGSGSEEQRVSGGEGNVGGPLHEEGELSEPVGEDVRSVDQQHQVEDRLLPDSEEVKRGSE